MKKTPQAAPERPLRVIPPDTSRRVLITVPAAARLLGCSVEDITRHLAEKRLTGLRFQGAQLVFRFDVQQFLKTSAVA